MKLLRASLPALSVSVITPFVAVLILSVVFAEPAHCGDVSNEIYKTVDGVELRMQIYTPDDHNPREDRRPAIVFFFGGGWKQGSPKQFESQCQYFARRGLLAATADYRVASRHGVKAVDCVEDAKSAVRWLRQNADQLGIDANRICAAGGSAGGHLAFCTATIKEFDRGSEDLSVSSVPNAVAGFNPAVMLAPLDDFGDAGIAAEKYNDLTERTGCDPRQISPVHHVTSELPPSIIFHGRADITVPYATVEEFARRMKAAGNRCDLHGFGGAPHGFFNPPREKKSIRGDRSDQWHRRTVLLLDQFLNSLDWLDDRPLMRAPSTDYVSLRGQLSNSLLRFSRDKVGHVAFLGGSITEMNGYRPLVMEWLETRFPGTDFQFTNAGIASTCSHTGAFRLTRDVLSHGPVDLLFVEFAVNDDQDAGYTAPQCLPGMEGIVRQLRRHNPHADIVMTHFVNPGMLETLRAGEEIESVSQHEAIARHYRIPSIDLPRITRQLIDDGDLTWKQYGGTHPGPAGNQLAATMMTSLLEAAWQNMDTHETEPAHHPLPEKLSPRCFDHGRLVAIDAAETDSAWQRNEPDWEQLPGSKRSRFLGIPLLHGNLPGSELSLEFTGNAVGAYLLAGPDAGQIDVQIDGGISKPLELYHRHSRGLHYPRTVLFASGLTDGPHVAKIRIRPQHHANSQGTAVRILNFVVNQTSSAQP